MAHEAVATLENDFLASVNLLDAAIHGSRPSAGSVARAYANLAYLRGYCDANARAFENIAPKVWRELYIRDEQVLAAFHRSVAFGVGEESLKANWITWLEARIAEAVIVGSCERSRRQAVEALRLADSAQVAVLDRLKLRPNASASGPVALFSALVQIEKGATREKLMRAWRAARGERIGDAVRLLDEHLALNRNLARRRGYASVLDKTLARGNCAEAEIADFLEKYAATAVERHRHLCDWIAADIDRCVDPLAHFPRFLVNKADGAGVVAFDFGRCLEFLLGVFADCLGVHGRVKQRGGILDIEIRYDGKRCGLISIDRLEGDWVPRRSLPDEPWARVLRHTRLNDTGREAMSFDAVQSLYHQCGHALSHVLSPHPHTSASGVDWLPAEQLERLSTWSEMWTFDEKFGRHLEIATELLARCRKIKALEFERGRLERVATSLFDFELHRLNERGVQATFAMAIKSAVLSPDVTAPAVSASFDFYRAHVGGEGA